MIYIDRKKENLREWQHVIALHFFPLKKIKWQEWHKYLINNLWKELGLYPNFAAAQGEYFESPVRVLDYKDVEHILNNSNYKDLRQFGFYVLRNKESNNRKDICSQSHIWSGIGRLSPEDDFFDSTAFFIIDDKKQKFHLEYFLEIAKKLHLYTGGVYGYYYYRASKYDAVPVSDELKKNKENIITINELTDRYIHASSCSFAGRESKWESIFYRREKMDYLRDIFRINFLSPHHLELVIDNAGTKLGDWISKGTESSRGVLGQLSKDFYYWHVEDADLQVEIRNQLAPSGHIICV